MAHDEMLCLRHVLDAMDTVEEYLQGVDEEKFKNTRLIQDGVIRQIEIIGEAGRHVSKDIRKSHPEILRQDVAGMRDKLIHGYFGVDIEKVWDTTRDDLPILRKQVTGIFKDFGKEI